MADSQNAVVLSGTFSRYKSLVARPLAINYSDGGASQRIEPNAEFLVDENRIKRDPIAMEQVASYVKARKVRLIEKGVKL